MTDMQHAREEAEREGTVVAPNATWPNRALQRFCYLVVLDHPRQRGPHKRSSRSQRPERQLGLEVGSVM